MLTHYEYLKSILEKILNAYENLTKLEDKPGDLVFIKKEILKINGFFHVFINKVNAENYQLPELSELKSKFEYYLDTYSFEKEMDTMSSLYSDDSNRLKNMRLKILESITEKKLMDSIEYTVKKL